MLIKKFSRQGSSAILKPRRCEGEIEVFIDIVCVFLVHPSNDLRKKDEEI